MNRTQEEISNTLKLVYTDNIIKYRIIHMRPHPALLLSILLLSNINDYKEDVTNIQEFYETNKKTILEQINKVIKDFNFKENDLLIYTKSPIIKDDDFNLIQVFSTAINTLYYAVCNKQLNPINILNSFSIYWGGEHILEAYIQGNFSNEPLIESFLKKKKDLK